VKKILFINPSKWGRGITPIWIASHFSILKEKFDVKLFDCTFFKNWTDNENEYNTQNNQYLKTEYSKKIVFSNKDIFNELQNKIDEYKPDVIFWSALSSHIHGEGEYVNIQYGYDLLSKVKTDKILLVTGGLQATASPELILKQFPKINYLISGESEFVLLEIMNNLQNKEKLESIDGLNFNNGGTIKKNKRQNIISDLNEIPPYDYSLFEDQIFFRPYNGKVLKALDYELSRGCIYTCSYCVETVIQNYYDFKETTKRGSLVNAKSYLRSKSAERIYKELLRYKSNHDINLVRCQDTNFLTINKKILLELEKLLIEKPLNIKLYIETRPEGINNSTIKLLKNIGVDGVGMGIELSGQEFRESSLNRFADQQKIIDAFKLLKDNGIKRTSYNIIGLPNQDEKSILNTIEFNRLLKPDNITVAFYSPYLGTNEQIKSTNLNYFDDYEIKVDGQLRSLSKNNLISLEKLKYYKKNFNNLVMNA
tara:strand:+ start:2043 stop:3485 length:1443 start_codon:yes stop_codon:yes gene_type:complete